MSVGGISTGGSTSGSNGESAATFLNSRAVQFAQMQGSNLSTLLTNASFGGPAFGGRPGRPSDLTSFTSAAVAMPLYQHAGLMSGLTQWDGSLTPGSKRTGVPAPVVPPSAPTAPTKPTAPASPFTFNPFDRASWWTNPKGATVDTAV
jgi:hypothetical protein